MERRQFLSAAIVASALGLSACASPGETATVLKPSTPAPLPKPDPVPLPPPAPTPPPPPPPPQFVPQFDLTGEPLWGLPDGVGNQLAWTVDDGASPEVVQAYANFAQQTGTRLTFFVNGMYSDSWLPAAGTLAPMIATGQV